MGPAGAGRVGMVGVALDARPRPVRAARRGVRSRVSAGHVVMIVAGLLGALFTLAALRSADERVDVVVARSDLAPGDVVQRNDLRTVRVNADGDALASFVRVEDVDALLGQVV